MEAEFQEDVIEDIYTNFDEDLEDDELSPAEAAFIRGYMEYPEEAEE